MPNIKSPSIKRYYPTVSSLIATDQIPDALGFIKPGLISFLDKLYYKDFQFSKSPNGDAAFYSIGIISKERLDIEIPGTGIYLVLNPDLGDIPDFNISVFPITFEYEWKILAYLRGFDLDNFSFSVQEIFEVALRVLNIDQEQAISQFINVFSEPASANVSHLEQYASDMSNGLSVNLSPVTPETTLKDINEEIYAETGDYSSMGSFTVYIDRPDVDESKARLKKYFRSLLPNDIEAYIKDLLLPKIKTSLALSAAIEFPRNILKPVYGENGLNPYNSDDLTGVENAVIEADENDDPKVLFTLGEVVFSASTEEGFAYEADLSISTLSRAQIGNTGLIIYLENIKIDLQNNKNIAAADADGRPNTFKGAFIEHASVTFPDIFKKEAGSTGSLVARTFLFGSEGGISGLIGFETDTIVYPINFSPTTNLDSNGNMIGFDYNPATAKMTISGFGKVFENDNDQEPKLVERTIDIVIPQAGMTLLDTDNKYYSIAVDGEVEISPGPGGFLKFKVFETKINISDFFLTFNKNKIVSSTVTGTILPKNWDEADALAMTIDFTDGLRIHVAIPDPAGKDVIDNNFFTLTLKDLELGRADEKIFLGLSGKVTNNLNIPFVNQFIPKTIEFDPVKWVHDVGFTYNLALAWSNKLTYNFGNENPPSLEEKSIYFPIVQEKEDGIFKLEGIEMGIKPIDTDNIKGLDSKFVFDGAKFNFKGLVSVVIDGMGFNTKLREEDPGDIGPFTTKFDFIPPTGLGLNIKTDGVEGGGYLYFDYDKGRFIGAAKLDIKEKFSVKVVGILLTKLPENPDGYSFLMMITVEGMDVPLGFGFNLIGVGGLVALHRSMDLQALRNGVKNKTIDNILFPEDPVENIKVIIADLEQVFPVQEGRHTFGLMTKIKWGKPQIITAEIGLMIEVPNPIKIAILGVVKTKLPKEEKDTLRIQISFVGTIDFEKKYITFDASIFDSRFAKFTLSGDMAFRLKWGDESNFLLSIGGFHPAYKPPPLDLPTLRRITINLLGSESPRLTLTAYFALTSNTVQFGAKLDFFYLIKKNWEAIGYLGFDILLQFSPFYLQADLYALLSIVRKGKAISTVSLGASLEGPGPWHAKGYASITVFGYEVKVNFDKTFGKYENEVLKDIDVWEKLKLESENAANWAVDQINQTSNFVSIRKVEVEEDEIIIDPNGIIVFTQAAVPLGFAIDKYGKQRPSNHNKFSLSIENGTEGGENFTNIAVTDLFAPAQFIAMSDSQKLARKSFEKMKAGARIAGSENYVSSYFCNFKLDYETVIYDTLDNPQAGNAEEPGQIAFQHFIGNNAVSNSEAGQGETISNSTTSVPNIGVSQESFAIANLADLTIHNHLGTDQKFNSETEARLAIEELFINNPALSNQIDVVAEYELA